MSENYALMEVLERCERQRAKIAEKQAEIERLKQRNRIYLSILKRLATWPNLTPAEFDAMVDEAKAECDYKDCENAGR